MSASLFFFPYDFVGQANGSWNFVQMEDIEIWTDLDMSADVVIYVNRPAGGFTVNPMYYCQKTTTDYIH